jgi:hypothetical protein
VAARNVTDAHVMDARNVTDAHVMDAVRDIAWTTDQHGRSKLTPEGLYGRRKRSAYMRRSTDRGLARCDDQADRFGDGPAADGDLAARP